MSSGADTRVVEMQFDNKDFERNVKTSIKTLDELKSSLNLDESAKSLSNLERVSKSFSLESMCSSIDELNSRFSTLGIVGINIINRITDSAINAAKKIGNILIVDPIRSGFQEYETQIDAIQTILANTSAEMDKLGYNQQERIDLVNDKLDELNHYADKTIYNFTQMTANIGRFTAAGIDLNTSVTAIQGIANLAAVSGSTSQQASTAMYQLSQALAAGSLKLQDWNSVVNAGMGGKVFQDALIQTATAMGVTVDKTVTTVDASGKKITKTVKKTVKELIEESGSFRESLSTGWITSDVLTETLSHFSWDFEELAKNSRKTDEEIDALRKALMERGYSMEEANKLLEQSTNLTVEQAKNLKKAELIAKGYTSDEADEIIKMAEAATEAATKVKTFTQLFDTLKEALQSGWTQTWEYIIGDFEEAKAFFTKLSDYFGEMINQSAESRNAVIKDWKELGGRNDLIDGMWNIIYGIENIFRTIKGAFQEIFPPATGEQLKNASHGFKEFTRGFKELTENAEIMVTVRSVFKGIASFVSIIRKGIGWIFGSVVGLAKHTDGIWSGFSKFIQKFSDFISSLQGNDKISNFVQDIADKLNLILQKVSGIFGSAFDYAYSKISGLYQKVKELGIFEKVGKHISNFLGRIPDGIDKLTEFTKSIIDMVKNSKTMNTVLSYARHLFSGIFNIFKDTDEEVNYDGRNGEKESVMKKIASKYDSIIEALKQWFENAKSDVTDVFDSVKDFFRKFVEQDIPGFFSFVGDGLKKAVDYITSIDWLGVFNTAFDIYSGIKMLQLMTGFVNISSGIKNIGKGFNGIGAGIKEIGKGIKNISKDGLEIIHRNKDSIGTTLLKIAASIGVIVAAMYVLAKMKTEDVIKGFGLVTLIATELLAVSKIFKSIDVDGKQFLMTAAAITLLVIPIKLLSMMKVEDALKGMVGIGIILTELALFTRMMGKGNENKIAFLGISIAVNLLVLAMKNIASLDPGQIAKGLSGMGLLLLELGLFIKSSGGKGKISGLIGIATAIGILVISLKAIGSMKIGQITKGLVGLGGMIVLFKILIDSVKGLKFGTALTAFLLMAGTIQAFIFAFKECQDMDMEQMLSFAASIGTILLSVAASMFIFSKIPVGAAIGGSVSAIAAFAVLIGGIGLVIAAFGAIKNHYPNSIDLINSGGDILEAIGTAIGRIGAGIINGATSTLPDVGTNISNFMENMKPFFDGVSSITEDAFNGAKNFAAVMTGIAWSEVLLSLASLFGDDPITKYVVDSAKLGFGLKLFALSVKGFNKSSTDDTAAAIEAGTNLTDLMKKVPWDSPDWVKALVGFKNVEAFAQNTKPMAEALNKFGENISGFENKATETDIANAITAANGIAGLIAGLHNTGGLLQEFTGFPDLDNFSEKLPGFADAMKLYAENLSGFSSSVSTKDIENSTNAAMGIAGIINSLPRMGGSWQKFTGIPDLGNFSKKLPEFAKAMIDYAGIIKDWNDVVIDESNVTKSTTAANGVAALINALPNEGGAWQDFAGCPSFTNFTNQLPGFAAAMMAYAKEIKDWNYVVTDDAITNSTKAAQGIVELAKSLDPTGGWWQSIVGAKDLGKFSSNVSSIGSALASFATNIASVNMDDSQKAVNVLGLIQSFISGLNDSGGLWNDIAEFFGGSKVETLLRYTGTMKTIGLDLKSFSTGINKVTIADVEYASTIFDSIMTFISGIPGISNFYSIDSTTMNRIVSISGYMATMGRDIGIFARGVSGVSNTILEFESVKTLIRTFIEYAELVKGWETSGKRNFEENYSNLTTMLDIIMAYGTAFNGFYNGIRDIDADKITLMAENVRKFVSAAEMAHGLTASDVASVQTLINEFSHIVFPVFDQEGANTAEAYITSLSNGIQNGVEAIKSAAGIASELGVDGAKTTFDVWVSTGVNLAMGMEQGILSMVGRVKSAATAVASGAARAIQITWQVHSPSRVGDGLGKNFDLGLVNGLSEYAKRVSGEATNVARGVVDSAKTLLLGSNSSIFDFIDPTPRIRPVIDMSGIEDGISSMNGLFAANHNINAGFFSGRTFSMGAGSLNFEGSRIIGSQDNIDVINELQILRDHIDDLNEAILNMQLVLDSGELVGGTVSKMDASLGNKSMMRNRAN